MIQTQTPEIKNRYLRHPRSLLHTRPQQTCRMHVIATLIDEPRGRRHQWTCQTHTPSPPHSDANAPPRYSSYVCGAAWADASSKHTVRHNACWNTRPHFWACCCQPCSTLFSKIKSRTSGRSCTVLPCTVMYCTVSPPALCSPTTTRHGRVFPRSNRVLLSLGPHTRVSDNRKRNAKLTLENRLETRFTP